MRLAQDIQVNPAEVPKALKPSRASGVTLFYALSFCLLGYAGMASAQRFRVEAAVAENDTRLTSTRAELTKLLEEATSLRKQAAISGDLAEWLTITPPAQSLMMLLTQQVEPNVSYNQVLIEADPGQPNMKVGLSLSTSDPDSASRQVARIQAALESAGFRIINVDTDSPTPEGWRYSALMALPANGDFALLTAQTSK